MAIEYEEKMFNEIKTDKYKSNVVFYIINTEDIDKLHSDIMESLNMFEYITLFKDNLYEIVSSNMEGNKLVTVSKVTDKDNIDKLMVTQYNVEYGLPDLLMEIYKGG